MRAITLHRPWPFCIAELGKRVENRTWAPPACLLGQEIAIHAGKAWDPAGARWIEEQFDVRLSSDDQMAGAIVALTRVLRVVRSPAQLTARERQWFFGPIGWVLDEPRVLARPVACRGAQGIWTVPPEIEMRVRAIAGPRIANRATDAA